MLAETGNGVLEMMYTCVVKNEDLARHTTPTTLLHNAWQPGAKGADLPTPSVSAARYREDYSVVTYQWASGGTLRQVQEMDPDAVAADPTARIIAQGIRTYKQAHTLALTKVCYCNNDCTTRPSSTKCPAQCPHIFVLCILATCGHAILLLKSAGLHNGLHRVAPLSGCCHSSSCMLLLLLFCVAAVTGPRAKGYKQLDRSGGVLPDTWIDLLLLLKLIRCKHV
jgi:hypothetical protein